MAALSTKEVERLIRQTAVQLGAADLADVLVATAIAENGLSNTNPGDYDDRGVPHSFGPFHENDRGRGSGLTREQMEDVVAATGRAVKEFRAVQKANPGVDMGTLAVLSQRPREDLRPNYTKRVNGLVGDMRVNGDPNRNGVGTQPANQARAGAQPGSGRASSAYVFPVAGYKQGQIPAHWGSNAPGARGAADLFAPEGTPVQVMAGGKVTRSYYDQGGGNSVEIAGEDGNTYYYAHLRDPSALKAGQVVKPGQALGFVGTTGNARTNNAPPHLHLGIGKGIIAGFGPDGGAGRDFDATTLLNQTLKGGAGYVTAGPAGTGGTRVARAADQIPEEEVNLAPEVVERQKRLDAAEAAAKDYETRFNQSGQAIQAIREKYAKYGLDPKGDAFGSEKNRQNLPPEVRLRPKNGQYTPGWDRLPGWSEENPDLAKDVSTWKASYAAYDSLNDKEKGEGKQWEAAKKNVEGLTDDLLRARQAARDRIAKEEKDKADTNKPTYQIDSESGSVLENGQVIGTLPRDAKPGTTFNVPGKGTFLLHPDGSVTKIEGTEPLADASWQDTGDQLVLVDRNGQIIQSLQKNVLTAPTVLGGQTGPKLTIWNPRTQKIETITNEGYVPKREPISAPRDTEFIVSTGDDGKLVVEKNPNWGSATGTSTTGRVYRVGADGTAQITDVLTPEERAIYNRGEIAKATGAEATAAGNLIDSATKLHDAEMKQREAQIWAEAQRVMADPNATREQVLGVIQAGVKNAKEWTDLLNAHVTQRTQEEVARHNKVAEGVSIQQADRELREGLYRDINQTREQRTNAQTASNQAQSRGIIGAANSANVLSAMAPLVGSEGIKGIGTIGLGVGEEVTGPVQKSWEEHQAELQKLRDQMPAIRLANPNVATPDFSLPRGNVPAGLTIPPVPGVNQGLIDKAKGLVGAGVSQNGTGGFTAPAGQGIGAAAAAAAKAVAAGSQPNIEAVDLGNGMAQQYQVSPTGERSLWGEQYKITPDEEEGGGGYYGPLRFKAPGGKRPKRRVA